MIGALRHRITIEQPSRSADGYGGFTTSWSTFASIWGEVEPVSARERMFAAKLEHNVTHKIRIRHLSGVTTDMRVSFDSRTFHIRGVINPSERSRWMDLAAEEGVAS